MNPPELGKLRLAEGVRLYLISRPALIAQNIEKFLDDEGTSWRRSPGATAAEEIVELGGRLCYMSFGSDQSPKTTSEYIANLISLGHESVLEHTTWTILITGVSRAFSHQLVRHRVGFAFSQLSQQYHHETDAKFVVPEFLDGHARATSKKHEAVRVTTRRGLGGAKKNRRWFAGL